MSKVLGVKKESNNLAEWSRQVEECRSKGIYEASALTYKKYGLNFQFFQFFQFFNLDVLQTYKFFCKMIIEHIYSSVLVSCTIPF